jgi:hypothetical protein
MSQRISARAPRLSSPLNVVAGCHDAGMAHRYRLTPTPHQEAVTREHSAHARFVWNLAYALSTWGTPETYGEASRRTREDGTTDVHQKHRPFRPLPGLPAQCQMLTEARAEFEWLAADPGQPDAYLPNRARAKAGLNKGILASSPGDSPPARRSLRVPQGMG